MLHKIGLPTRQQLGLTGPAQSHLPTTMVLVETLSLGEGQQQVFHPLGCVLGRRMGQLGGGDRSTGCQLTGGAQGTGQ